MSDHLEIPLFPLQRVLYPGVSLPLKIFEQRYLRLIKESLAQHKPFAVVPILEGGEVGAAPDITPRGTLVEIVDWSQLPDGLLGVVVRGRGVVTVESSRVEEDGLLVAELSRAREEMPLPLGEEDQDLLILLIELSRHLRVEQYYLGAHLMEALGSGLKDEQLFEDKQVVGELDQSTLVWRLADLLPVTRARKIAFFDLPDPAERLKELRRWLLDLQAK